MVTTKKHRIFSARSFADSDASNDDDVIRGVSLITEGEAKGHGVQVDSVLLSQLLELGKKFQTGVRANLGHFTGMENAFGFFNNLRIAGKKLIGDLHLFREHEKYALIKRQIATIPDTFGFSLFFDGPDEEKEETLDGVKVKILFARASDWMSADCVDCPAANPSGVFMTGPTARGQIDDSTVDSKKEVSMATETDAAPDMKKEIQDMLSKHADHMSKMNDRMDEMCERLAIGTNDTPVKKDEGAAELQDKEGKEKDSSPGNPGGSAMDDKEKEKMIDEKEMSRRIEASNKALEARLTASFLKALADQKISPPATATAASATDGASNGNGKHTFKTFHEACRHSLSEITGSATPKSDAMKLAAEKYPELYKAYEMGQRNGESWTREALFSTPEKKQRNLSIIASGRLL